MSAQDKEAAEVEGSQGSGSRRSTLWGGRVAKFLTSCSGSLGSTGMLHTVCLLFSILAGGIRHVLDQNCRLHLVFTITSCFQPFALGALNTVPPMELPNGVKGCMQAAHILIACWCMKLNRQIVAHATATCHPSAAFSARPYFS